MAFAMVLIKNVVGKVPYAQYGLDVARYTNVEQLMRAARLHCDVSNEAGS